MQPNTAISTNLMGEPLDGYVRCLLPDGRYRVVLEGCLEVDLPERDLQVRDQGKKLCPREDE